MLEECRLHKGGGALCLGPFLVGKTRQLKSSALLWIVTILWTNFEMAASQSEQPSVEQALEQIADIEVEEEGESDPLECLGNQEIAKIYHQLSPEDRQLFRQFKAFHKLHYDLYGHDAPSYQLTRGTYPEYVFWYPYPRRRGDSQGPGGDLSCRTDQRTL